MDKTTVFDTTLCPNNRKPAADSKRYTESFLCDEIHANLRAMSYLVPFHSDLEVVFAHVSEILFAVDRHQSTKQLYFLILLQLYRACLLNQMQKHFHM